MRSAALALVLTLLAACGGEAKGPQARPEEPLDALEVADALGVLQEAGEREPAVLDRIVAAGDRRFAAVLIELLRASQIGLRESPHYNAEVIALERLTGHPFGSDWIRWTSWYAGTGLSQPPGFADLKAHVLGRIDPALGAFFAGDPPGAARPLEIVWDGNPPDPVRDAPPRARLRGEQAADAPAGEAVLGVEHAGAAVAFPIRLLEATPVRNEVVGGEPVLVVWCSLCSSGSAWASAGGTARRFALSGLVYRSVPLLYDEATRTLWDALTGRPQLGPAARDGEALVRIPAVVTTWEAWRARHPDGVLLAPPVSGRSPYASYVFSEETIFPTLEPPDPLAAKTQVFGLALGFRARAWELDALLGEGVVDDELAGTPLVLVATRPRVLMRVAPDPWAEPWSPGAEVRAYRAPDVALEAGPDPDTLVDAKGGAWRVTDAALLGPGGERAPRLAGTLAYWFAWHALYPDTTVWTR